MLPSNAFEKEIIGWAEKAINDDTPFEAICDAVNYVSASMAFAFSDWLAKNFVSIVEKGLVTYEDVNNLIFEHFKGVYIASELWIHFLKLIKSS